MSPLASYPSKPEATTARPQHLNINWAAGGKEEACVCLSMTSSECCAWSKYNLLTHILQKINNFLMKVGGRSGSSRGPVPAEVKMRETDTCSWDNVGQGARLTSGTFLLNSLLSSTRCLWECSLSSCRPASSEATEFSSLCKHTHTDTHTKEREMVRGWKVERHYTLGSLPTLIR